MITPIFYEGFLLVLTGLVGALMTGWSLMVIFGYFRSSQKNRYRKRIIFRVAWFVLLIGIGDLSKVIRETIAFFGVND